jgi:hypothetical protein
MRRSIIINHLQSTVQSQANAVLFLYCNYKERSKHTIANLFSSLLQQLLLQLPSLPTTATALYDLHKRRMTRPSLDDIIKLLISLLSQFSDCFVVIDALDEAEEDVRSDLVEAVLALSQNVRLLCTSRFLEDINEIFQNKPKLEIRAHEDDIRKYLHTRIMGEGRLKRHIDAEPQLLHEVTESIISKVQGM